MCANGIIRVCGRNRGVGITIIIWTLANGLVTSCIRSCGRLLSRSGKSAWLQSSPALMSACKTSTWWWPTYAAVAWRGIFVASWTHTDRSHWGMSSENVRCQGCDRLVIYPHVWMQMENCVDCFTVLQSQSSRGATTARPITFSAAASRSTLSVTPPPARSKSSCSCCEKHWPTAA